MNITQESSLFGPDVSEKPAVDGVEEVGGLDARARQFCNRWVFLQHQRPFALAELKDLLAAVKDRQ